MPFEVPAATALTVNPCSTTCVSQHGETQAPAVPLSDVDLEDKSPCLCPGLDIVCVSWVAVNLCVLMDYIDRSQLRNFKKDDFEADWTKVAECRFGQTYQVKLKVWRVKCALKSFHTNLCPNNFYRWDWEMNRNDHALNFFQVPATFWNYCSLLACRHNILYWIRTKKNMSNIVIAIWEYIYRIYTVCCSDEV